MLKWEGLSQKRSIIYTVFTEKVICLTGALDEEPKDVRGPGRGLGRLSAKGTGCGGQGQGLLPYFFMRATLTEERKNEWPVRRNENE